MINCDKYKELISLYIDGLLDEKDKSQFEKHIKNCSNCEKDLYEMQQLISLCNSLPDKELPTDFGQKLHSKLLVTGGENHKRKVVPLFGRKYVKVLSTVAACIAVAFLVKGALWWNDVSNSDLAGSKPQTMADSSVNENDTQNKKPEKMADASDSVNLKSVSPKLDSVITGAKDEAALHDSKSSKNSGEAAIANSPDAVPFTSKEKASIASKTSSRSSASDQAMIAAIPDQPQAETEAAAPDLDNIPVTSFRESSVVIISRNPITELVNLQYRAKVYGIEFINASPQGILQLDVNSKKGDGENSPDVITLICKVKQTVYDQFTASLKTVYSQTAISVDPIDTIDTSDKYKELNNKIAGNETKIRALQYSSNPDDTKSIDILNQQVNQYKKELAELTENSKFISLTIVVRK